MSDFGVPSQKIHSGAATENYWTKPLKIYSFEKEATPNPANETRAVFP